ncbi:MAG: pyridoxamine 5'-phosphate oxidase family protein [Ilumatobacter sp.]|nr:pyridoxamine 5'-phosphate oxidase family protein [Ilumatobacter sp.]
MEIGDRITTSGELDAFYRAPSEVAANKVFTTIDDATARFIDRCPFLVLSTTNGTDSIDASPRGGPPGFLQRLDDRHIAIPDLNGNNRLDSLRNIVAHGRVGLLLMVPGKDETIRINGPATLTTSADILDGFTAELRRPKLAIVVETAELYGHCAKAFRRGRVWDPASWEGVADAPDLADIVAEQFGMDLDVSRARLESSYVSDLARD